MSEQAEQAVEFGLSGCSCSQSILRAFGNTYGITAETALRLGSGLSGGMGMMAGTCGAVSAAYLVLGLHYGESEPGDKDRRQIACAKVQEFASAFTLRRGSTECRIIAASQGIDLPAEWPQFMEQGLVREFCPHVIRDAAELLEILLTNS